MKQTDIYEGLRELTESFWDCLFKNRVKKKSRSKLSFMDKTRNLVFSLRLRMSEMYRYGLKVRGMSNVLGSLNVCLQSDEEILPEFQKLVMTEWSFCNRIRSDRLIWSKGNRRPLLTAAVKPQCNVIT